MAINVANFVVKQKTAPKAEQVAINKVEEQLILAKYYKQSSYMKDMINN